MDRQASISALRLSFRAALSGAAALAIAERLSLPFPIYALIAAVMVTDLSPAITRAAVIPRLGGTILGAVWGALLSSFVPATAGAIFLGVLLSIFVCHYLRLQDSAKLAGYVCAIAMLNYGYDPWGYAFFRLFETTLGIVIAVLVSQLPTLSKVDSAPTAL